MTTLYLYRISLESTDFSWIASCTALTELMLLHTSFADLSPLASCKALKSIGLTGCCEIYRIDGETPDDYEYLEPKYDDGAHDEIHALFEQLPQLTTVYPPEGGTMRAAAPGAYPVYESDSESDCDRFDY